MNNDIRRAMYLERNQGGDLTPAQRRRIKHKANSQRTMLRRAHADVVKADRRRRFAIRAMFARRAS